MAAHTDRWYTESWPEQTSLETSVARPAKRATAMTQMIDRPEANSDPVATGGTELARTGAAPALPVPLVLRMSGGARMDAAQFFEFCQQNENYRIERCAAGGVIIMPPAGTPSSGRNMQLSGHLWYWAQQDGTGVVYESSAGFRLPNGAVRSPDASWIRKDRLAALTPEQRTGFWAICPDSVAELRSAADSLSTLQTKMEEYRDNGAQLGWLIDPEARKIYVYRPGQPVETLDDPATVSGDPVLPGFVLDAAPVFATSF
jgi:Uma2 family endonuclease